MNVSLETLLLSAPDWPVAQRREWAELVTIGDALGGIVHDISNNLNTIMLQAALVQLKTDESLRADVAVIRHEGAQIAERLALLQRLREHWRNEQETVDLNAAIQDVVPRFAADLQIRTALDTTPLTLRVNPAALKRLLALMMILVARNATTGAVIAVTTQIHGARIQLTISLEGSSAPEQTSAVHDHIVDQRIQGMVELERVAIQSLARLVFAELFLPKDSSGAEPISASWRASGRTANNG